MEKPQGMLLLSATLGKCFGSHKKDRNIMINTWRKTRTHKDKNDGE